MLDTNLRIARAAHGLSQTELAKQTGFSHHYLSQLERGLRPTRSEDVDRIARALKLSPATLLRGDLRARVLDGESA